MTRKIDPEKAEIGARIADRRKEIGLLQKDLAEKLGLSVGAVGQWERGWTMPDPKMMDKLIEELGTTREWLITGTNRNPDDYARDILERELLSLSRGMTVEDRFNLIEKLTEERRQNQRKK